MARRNGTNLSNLEQFRNGVIMRVRVNEALDRVRSLLAKSFEQFYFIFKTTDFGLPADIQ